MSIEQTYAAFIGYFWKNFNTMEKWLWYLYTKKRMMYYIYLSVFTSVYLFLHLSNFLHILEFHSLQCNEGGWWASGNVCRLTQLGREVLGTGIQYAEARNALNHFNEKESLWQHRIIWPPNASSVQFDKCCGKAFR